MRLCRVVMFCLIANSWIVFSACGVRAGDELELTAAVALVELQVGGEVADGLAGRLAGGVVTEIDDHGVALAGDAGVTDGLVAKLGAKVARGGVETFGERAGHVDLQQEVHPRRAGRGRGTSAARSGW